MLTGLRENCDGDDERWIVDVEFTALIIALLQRLLRLVVSADRADRRRVNSSICSARSLRVVTREGQPERGHLLAVANQQEVADDHRVVPGLAVERWNPRELRELVGGRRDERQLAVLRRHQQQVLIGQQNELAAAVASALPFALAVLEIDACEDV